MLSLSPSPPQHSTYGNGNDLQISSSYIESITTSRLLITFSSEYIPAKVALMLATASESSQNLLESEPYNHVI